MTNPIPPCPVCGTLPSAETYIRHPVIIPACKCITTQMQGPKEWTMVCESVLGRALQTHGINTLAELESRLAPDPRVAELEKSERELSDAYLRVRKLLNAYDTKFGGSDRFEVTEAAIVALQEKAKSVAPDPRVAVWTELADYIESCIGEDPDELTFVLNPFDSAESRGIETGKKMVLNYLRNLIAAQRGEGQI